MENIGDVYLRIGKGPIQHFRAWDVPRFLATTTARYASEKDGPVVVVRCTQQQYRAERWSKQ